MINKVAFCACSAVLIFGVACNMCGTDVWQEVNSPDGKYKAVIFERDCGATTDFSTQVSIIKSSTSVGQGDSGNAFVADSNHGAVAVNGKGILPIEVRWIDSRTVEVSAPAKARVFSRRERVGDVNLQYRFE